MFLSLLIKLFFLSASFARYVFISAIEIISNHDSRIITVRFYFVISSVDPVSDLSISFHASPRSLRFPPTPHPSFYRAGECERRGFGCTWVWHLIQTWFKICDMAWMTRWQYEKIVWVGPLPCCGFHHSRKGLRWMFFWLMGLGSRRLLTKTCMWNLIIFTVTLVLPLSYFYR